MQGNFKAGTDTDAQWGYTSAVKTAVKKKLKISIVLHNLFCVIVYLIKIKYPIMTGIWTSIDIYSYGKIRLQTDLNTKWIAKPLRFLEPHWLGQVLLFKHHSKTFCATLGDMKKC